MEELQRVYDEIEAECEIVRERLRTSKDNYGWSHAVLMGLLKAKIIINKYLVKKETPAHDGRDGLETWV